MATLSIPRTYADSDVLFQADLDTAFNSVETFTNITKLGSDNIQDAAITATELATSAITTAKIAANAVDSTKLSSDAVTDANRAVTTDHIRDLAVTTAKIADGAVTQAKRAALGQQVSSSSSTFTDATTVQKDVTNLSVTITTTGRPVEVFVTPDGSTNAAIMSGSGYIYLLRDGSSIAKGNLGLNSLPYWGFLDTTAAAGSHTYKIQIQGVSGTITMQYLKLNAYEG